MKNEVRQDEKAGISDKIDKHESNEWRSNESASINGVEDRERYVADSRDTGVE